MPRGRGRTANREQPAVRRALRSYVAASEQTNAASVSCFFRRLFMQLPVFVYPIVLVNMNFKSYFKRISLALSHLSSNSPFFVSRLKLKRAKDKRGALFCDQATLTKEKKKGRRRTQVIVFLSYC